MSHEIRTPLHGVITSTDLLLTTQQLNPEQLPYVQTIHHSALHLLGVIDSVLDWTKIEAGKLTLENTDFDLHGVLQRVVMALSLQAETKGLTLHLDIGPTVPYRLRGDPTRLSQILMNLAGNAVKFTERGGIRIKVAPILELDTEVTLRFEVIDTGIGIPAAAQARNFQDFAQADESTARRYGGTGLGTAISKFLVELMGGHIGFQSEPGQGSCFWFEVPFSRQYDEAPAVSRELQPTPAPGTALPHPTQPRSPLRILIAEDNPTNQFVIDQLLQTAGHRPFLVGNGRQALEALETEAFDLALLDMHMAWERVREAVHTLKGASATVGAERIMALCIQIEDAAKADCKEDLKTLTEQLRLAIAATFDALEDYRQASDIPEIPSTAGNN